MRLTNLLFMVVLVALFVPLLIAREAGVLSSAAVVGLLFAWVIVMLTLFHWIGARQVRREREQFVSSRSPLPDNQFLGQMGASGDYGRFCLIVRDGFSLDCCVGAEMIRPEDTLRQLERLCFDGFFLHEIIFALEREFPGRAADLRLLPPFRQWKTITLGELIERCARELGFKGSQAPT
jgi:hypothetical protein